MDKIMTPEEFEKKMQEMEDGTTEYGWGDRHRGADWIMSELLESLGYEKGVEIYRDMDKGYEFSERD